MLYTYSFPKSRIEFSHDGVASGNITIQQLNLDGFPISEIRIPSKDFLKFAIQYIKEYLAI